VYDLDTMNTNIRDYNQSLSKSDSLIADTLCKLIDTHLPNAESKIWHGHPVWFIDGNPIVGYSKVASSVRLLFWSGQSFNTTGLTAEGKFKAADAQYTDVDQIVAADVLQWLAESIEIQWDYKNIVKRRGELLRLK
jgi:hypothetical protein